MALGDVSALRATAAALLYNLSPQTRRVFVSAGSELSCDKVVVLGEAQGWVPGLVLGVRPMADVPDIGAAQALVAILGGPGRMRTVFAKGEPNTAKRIRGQRDTILANNDSETQRQSPRGRPGPRGTAHRPRSLEQVYCAGV